MWRQMLRFGLVGALATLVHIIIGFLLIQSGWPALIANAAAFMTAFSVSFVGHLGFSFADQNVRFSTALWKFAIVSVLGFCFNEALLVALLHYQVLTESYALIASTSCAAVLTFALSKVWAFQNTRDRTFDLA